MKFSVRSVMFGETVLSYKIFLLFHDVACYSPFRYPDTSTTLQIICNSFLTKF